MSRLVLARDTVVYGGTLVLRSAVGIFLLPIYTRVLRPEDYAKYDLVVAAAGFIALLLDLQLGPAVIRFFQTHRAAGTNREFLGGSLTFLGTTALTIAALLAIIAPRANIGDLLPIGDSRLIWSIAVLAVPFTLMNELMFVFLRLLERKWTYSTVSLLNATVAGSFAILFVVGLKMGALGIVLGQGLGNLIGFLVLATVLRRELVLRWTPPALGRILSYGLPLVPALLLGWVWLNMSRFFLATTRPLAEVAVFALGLKVMMFLGFLGAAFRAAWDPIAMKILHEQQEASGEWYATTFGMYACVLLLLVAVLSALARPLVSVLGPPSYASAAGLVPFLAISSALGFAASSLNIGNQIAGKTWHWSAAMATSVGVTAALLLCVASRFGVVAASAAMMMGSFAQVLVVYQTGQTSHWIPYRKATLALTGLGLVLIALIHTVSLSGRLTSYAEPILMVIVSVICTYLASPRNERILLGRAALAVLRRNL